MKKVVISAVLLVAFALASCTTSDPTYRKNDGLNQKKHSAISRTSGNRTYCH
ncbi:MAG: hypothetical protein J6V30_00065 [Paludibacteraceae bacterium]|jgi:outer membrane protein assembly factor BamE (lipoprotein component of BamABCDE complex)|nr:hypothetical protein [Paludibacteraceae bacterium]